MPFISRDQLQLKTNAPVSMLLVTTGSENSRDIASSSHKKHQIRWLVS